MRWTPIPVRSASFSASAVVSRSGGSGERSAPRVGRRPGRLVGELGLLVDGEPSGLDDGRQLVAWVAAHPDRRADEGNRDVVQVGLDHPQHQPPTGPQQLADALQGGGNVRPREHQQGEERHDGIERPQTRVDTEHVGLPELCARDVRPSEVEHHRRDVDPHHFEAGVHQLSCGGQAGASADVEDATAGRQPLEQPATAAELTLLVREDLVVPAADRVERRGLSGHPGVRLPIVALRRARRRHSWRALQSWCGSGDGPRRWRTGGWPAVRGRRGPCREGPCPTPHHDGRDDQVVLVDQSGLDRLGGQAGAAHAYVAPGGRLHLPNRLGVEVPLDPRPGAGHRLQRPRVDDLVGRLPDPGVLLQDGRLANEGFGRLPGHQHLVHPASEEVGAHRSLEVVDEGVHLLVRRRPVEVAVLVGHVAVERRDRRVDELRHGEPPASSKPAFPP